ncbi:MAG: epoxyqueuosine reductase QueH [Thermacetogeniaceae bacterium]
MRVLIHVCCGPCAMYPVQELLNEGHEVAGYFYNPNIHPYQEYNKRLEGALQMAGHFGIPLRVTERYSPEVYFREVAFREDQRCRLCYEMRLREAGRFAKENGYEAFTTTLLVSPWQKHDLLQVLGEAIGRELGIPFLYRDWRRGFSEGRRQAKELGLYRQQYCGCIYSERERYEKEAMRNG